MTEFKFPPLRVPRASMSPSRGLYARDDRCHKGRTCDQGKLVSGGCNYPLPEPRSASPVPVILREPRSEHTTFDARPAGPRLTNPSPEANFTCIPRYHDGEILPTERVRHPTKQTLPLHDVGLGGGANCDWINADHAASPSCLYPNPPYSKYPHDAVLKHFGNSECFHRKINVACVRAWRMAYWGYVMLQAIQDLPPGARKAAWDQTYHTKLPPKERVYYTGGLYYWFNLEAYFGSYDPDNAVMVRDVYRSIFAGMRFQPYPFILTADSEHSCATREAFNHKGVYIGLCFTSFKGSTTNELATAIVHEYCHNMYSLDDQMLNGKPAYYPDAARTLADYHVSLAMKNIDNYAYWLSGMWLAWNAQCSIPIEPVKHAGKTYTFDKKKLVWKVT